MFIYIRITKVKDKLYSDGHTKHRVRCIALPTQRCTAPKPTEPQLIGVNEAEAFLTLYLTLCGLTGVRSP